MKIVGVDCASSTGLCFMPAGKAPWDWRCLAIEAEGAHGLERAGDYTVVLRDYLEEEQPDLGIIEAPIGIVPHGKINANTVTKLWALGGATVAVFELLGIPWCLIAIQTWRAAYYGKGVKPAGGDDWKDLAVAHAERQGIRLPDNLKAKRDCAEAAGIAASWTHATLIPAVHQAAFLRTRLGKPLRQEAPAA